MKDATGFLFSYVPPWMSYIPKNGDSGKNRSVPFFALYCAKRITLFSQFRLDPALNQSRIIKVAVNNDRSQYSRLVQFYIYHGTFYIGVLHKTAFPLPVILREQI